MLKFNFKASDASKNRYVLFIEEGSVSTRRLKCSSSIPFTCANTGDASCSLAFDLNYISEPKEKRIVFKECSQNSDNKYICNPKNKEFTPNKNWLISDNEIIWDIGVTTEAKNLHFKDEKFSLRLTNTLKNAHQLFSRISRIDITVYFVL